VSTAFNKPDSTCSCEFISAFFFVDFPPLIKNSLGCRCKLAVLIDELSKRDVFFNIYLASSYHIALLKVKLSKDHAVHSLIDYPVVG
jgi:hypothetical protein